MQPFKVGLLYNLWDADEWCYFSETLSDNLQRRCYKIFNAMEDGFVLLCYSFAYRNCRANLQAAVLVVG